MLFSVSSVGEFYWLEGPVCWLLVLVNMLDRTMFWERERIIILPPTVAGSLLSSLQSQSNSKSDLTVFLCSRAWCRSLGVLAGYSLTTLISLSLSLIFATADTFLQQQAKSITWLTDTDPRNIFTSLHLTVNTSPSQMSAVTTLRGCWPPSRVETT